MQTVCFFLSDNDRIQEKVLVLIVCALIEQNSIQDYYRNTKIPYGTILFSWIITVRILFSTANHESLINVFQTTDNSVSIWREMRESVVLKDVTRDKRCRQ